MGKWIELQAVPGARDRWVRAEPFGGTVSFRRPEMLVMVDHAFLGQRQPKSATASGRLDPAAPYEAHLTVGHRCTVGCPGCYIDAREDGPAELGFDEWQRVLDKLASLGVFHVALGAGESTPLAFLIDLAHYARGLGITPNLSTAGLHLTPRLAQKLGVFGRVHLSLDGAGRDHMRGRVGFASALMSLRILRAYHPRVGVNCVVTRASFPGLGRLFRMLKREGVVDVELLRFKPAGRGAELFAQMDLTTEQKRTVVQKVLQLARRYRMRPRLDCSFAPMVCAAGYDPTRLVRMGLAGCVGGSWLVAVDGRGCLSACSFDNTAGALSWSDLGRPGMMTPFTNWIDQAPSPCAECRWLQVCRGGCHVVARHLTGDFNAPDPGCPLVQAQA